VLAARCCMSMLCWWALMMHDEIMTEIMTKLPVLQRWTCCREWITSPLFV